MSVIVVDNRTDRNVAVANSNLIDAQILTSKSYVKLPPGELTLDRPPALRSGVDLIGEPNNGTRLRLYSALDTPIRYFGQIGYTQASDILRPVEPNEWMFEFRYYDYPPPDGLGNMVRRVKVTAVNSKGLYTTTPPRNPKAESVQRFHKAWEVTADIRVGDQSVLLASVEGIEKGMWLWITDGPLQNAGQGYMRRVEVVEANRVWLHRPLPRNFGPALACDIKPLVNTNVRSLTIDPGTFLWSVGLKGTAGFGMENVNYGQGNVQVISSGGFNATAVEGGAFEFNTAAECRIRDSRAPYFYAEEGTDGIEVLNSTFGPSRRGYPQNCVTAFFQVRNLRFRNVIIEGAGQPLGGWPTASFSVQGTGMDFADIAIKYPVITNNQGPWAGFGGDGLQIHRLTSDLTALAIQLGTGIDLSYVLGPYIELQRGTSGRAAFCSPLNVQGGGGWQTFGVPNLERASSQTVQESFALPGGCEQKPEPPKFRHVQTAQPGKSGTDG